MPASVLPTIMPMPSIEAGVNTQFLYTMRFL